MSERGERAGRLGAREEMLALIRAARAAVPVEVPRAYRATGDHAPGAPELVDLFVRRLVDYRATVHRVAADGIPEAVLAAASPVAAGRRPVLVVPPGLPAGWLPAAV
ncbi:MAG TPA: hypothetical protein VFT95_21150, partial [Micromonosporaceae bacterium]|nr:hypothetical protein [Micromonosporaceae bacterium]